MARHLTQEQTNGPPLVGHYKTRLVKGGVMIPVHIRRRCTCSIGGYVDHEHTNLCDRWPLADALVNGKPAYLDEVWERAVWLVRIARAEYEAMLADIIWCEQYAPADPKANVGRSVDLNQADPIF